MMPKIEVNLTKVVEDLYTDALKGPMRELSKISVNTVKAVHLVLFPLQFAGAFQDRIAFWLDKAIRNVPSERRIDPLPSLVSPVIDKLKYFDEGELLGEVYCNLLSRALDKEGVGDAHPAFVNIISQLSPDEVLLINHISNPSGRIYFGRESDDWAVSLDSISKRLKEKGFEGDAMEFLRSEAVDPENLALPSYLNMYVSHLQALNVLNYNNSHKKVVIDKMKLYEYEKEWWTVELSSFGRLFYSACVKESLVSGLKAEK